MSYLTDKFSIHFVSLFTVCKWAVAGNESIKTTVNLCVFVMVSL